MKLAIVENIINVIPHINADNLDIVTIMGYRCITLKGLYKPGDKVIFIPSDTILPKLPWAEKYRNYIPNRVKAIKLRGEWSEGIILPMDVFEKALFEFNYPTNPVPPVDFFKVGDDVGNYIGVTKYETPVHTYLQGKSLLPYGIRKTDEERWENMVEDLPFGELVDVTLKIDGQSWSAYYKVDTKEFSVLSRTLELRAECVNNYTNHLKRYNIKEKLINLCEKNNVSLCIRGESYGIGIQCSNNNPHKNLPNGLALFSTYNLDTREYENKGSKFYFEEVSKILRIPSVPILERDVILTQDLINKYSKEITQLNSGNIFEGVVIKHSKGTFKVLNLSYDSKK